MPVKPIEAIPSTSESQIASKNASLLEAVPEKPTATPIPVKTPNPPVVIAANKPAEKPPEPASKPVAPANKPVTVPPAEKDPVTIRKAILPTPEELEKMKQGHVQRKVGQLPEQNTASPLVQARD